MATTWQHGGWNASGDSAWDRIKEAIRRDWEQTLHDLQIDGGHELNQGLADTIKQAAGRQTIPRRDQPNPRKGIGRWGRVDASIRYGAGGQRTPEQGARFEPIEPDPIETTLRSEWDPDTTKPAGRWGFPRGDERRD